MVGWSRRERRRPLADGRAMESYLLFRSRWISADQCRATGLARGAVDRHGGSADRENLSAPAERSRRRYGGCLQRIEWGSAARHERFFRIVIRLAKHADCA